MRAFEAMGTRFECVLASFACADGPSVRMAIAEELERLVLDWHHTLSVFDPSSTISRINACAGEGFARVDQELFELLERCIAYSESTGGTFDVTLGSVMAARGFRSARPTRSSHGIAALRLDQTTSAAGIDRPDVQLDLGGIAKGFALDLCGEELRDLGVTGALVHGGTSSAIAIGTAPNGSPWRVRVCDETSGAPVVDLTDRALSVSAPSGRVVGGEGHILDPRTGSSATGVERAFVVGPSAEVCEAWSTAIVVAPPLLDRLPSGYAGSALIDGAWMNTEDRLVCA